MDNNSSISNNEYKYFNDYIKNISNDEKKIIFKLIDKNILPNLFLYNDLENPINFTDFIKDIRSLLNPFSISFGIVKEKLNFDITVSDFINFIKLPIQVDNIL